VLLFQTPFARQQKPQKPNTTANNEKPLLFFTVFLSTRERKTKPPRIPSILHATPSERKMKRTREEEEEARRRKKKYLGFKKTVHFSRSPHKKIIRQSELSIRV